MAEALVPCPITREGVTHSDPCTCGDRFANLDEVEQREVVVGSAKWRDEHCRLGDAALRDAQEIADREDGDTLILSAAAQTFTSIAQAHYTAANVRAPGTGPAELRTKTPYVIPGVEGVWEIRGMTTENFGATGTVELRLYRVEGS